MSTLKYRSLEPAADHPSGSDPSNFFIVHEGDKYFSSFSALAYDEREQIVYFTEVNKYVLQRWAVLPEDVDFMSF